MAIKIWTSLYELKQADLVRNRKLYTIELDDHEIFPMTLEQWIEMDAEPSPRMAYVTVQSPEGFGPTHPIKIYSPTLAYEDVIKTTLMRNGVVFGCAEHWINVLVGAKKDPWVELCKHDPYSHAIESIKELEERLGRIKSYIAMLKPKD